MTETTGTRGQSATLQPNSRAHLQPVVRAVVPSTRLVNVAGAARFLGVSRRSVFRMLEAGALKAVRLPAVRALRFDLRDLERLVEGAKL